MLCNAALLGDSFFLNHYTQLILVKCLELLHHSCCLSQSHVFSIEFHYNLNRVDSLRRTPRYFPVQRKKYRWKPIGLTYCSVRQHISRIVVYVVELARFLARNLKGNLFFWTGSSGWCDGMAASELDISLGVDLSAYNVK